MLAAECQKLLLPLHMIVCSSSAETVWRWNNMPVMFLCSPLTLRSKILQVRIVLFSILSTMKSLASSSMLKNLHGRQKRREQKSCKQVIGCTWQWPIWTSFVPLEWLAGGIWGNSSPLPLPPEMSEALAFRYYKWISSLGRVLRMQQINSILDSTWKIWIMYM